MRYFSSCRAIVVMAALALSALSGCRQGAGSGSEPTVNMGTTVAVGNLKYTVFQS